MKGFTDTIKEIAPEMNVIEYATAFTREDGLKDFTDILAANKQIDAVYSLDDETSIGVLQAIEDAGRTDIKVITGGGGCQEYFKIIKEHEDINICSALYSPLMVREAVDMAVSVLKGEKVDPVLAFHLSNPDPSENILPLPVVLHIPFLQMEAFLLKLPVADPEKLSCTKS